MMGTLRLRPIEERICLPIHGPLDRVYNTMEWRPVSFPALDRMLLPICSKGFERNIDSSQPNNTQP